MTTQSARNPVCIEIPPSGDATTLEVRWELSALAGRALAQAHGLHGRAIVGASLAVVIGSRGAAVATLDLVDQSGARASLWSRRGLEAERTRDERHGMVHVDVPGVVCCSMRTGPDAAAVFVRTDLLGEIGAPPGSYTLRGARFAPEA